MELARIDDAAHHLLIELRRMHHRRLRPILRLIEALRVGRRVGAHAVPSEDVERLAAAMKMAVRADDGKLDEAVAMYQELLNVKDPVVARDTLNFQLAKVYEKQGKTKEAADIYYDIAKKASEAKDPEGKPQRMTSSATDAKEKLKQLDPERAKEIVEPSPESPFG